MSTFTLPNGREVPRLGQGAWRIGEQPARRAAELAALRTGLDLGLTLIDTAEMYGDGRSEELVAEAIAGRREHVFVVSKVLPQNASRAGTVAACKRSLKRLKTDYLDLYLLHWRQGEPLDETLEAFIRLRDEGAIRAYGVSNFDRDDLDEAAHLAGGRDIAANQVLYNLEHRGIEWDLLDHCRERGMTVMAYSPLGSGGQALRRLLGDATLKRIAERRSASPAQVALAWVLRKDGVVVIPKAGSAAHVADNARALGLALEPEDLADLDAAFPPPRRKVGLEMS
jgi:diketogulonate reductase-like aldo/keto reductase